MSYALYAVAAVITVSAFLVIGLGKPELPLTPRTAAIIAVAAAWMAEALVFAALRLG